MEGSNSLVSVIEIPPEGLKDLGSKFVDEVASPQVTFPLPFPQAWLPIPQWGMSLLSSYCLGLGCQ
jgi:hypothetical protein